MIATYHQLGSDANPANNILLRGNGDGSFSICKGAAGSETVLATFDSGVGSGWAPDLDTWTCTTAGVAGSFNVNGSVNVAPVAAVFTVPGDKTAQYRRGTKLRWTQNGAKYYGHVESASYAAGVTTVTLVKNFDYTMALSSTFAITSPGFSFANPPDFPANFNYVGGVVPIAGVFTSVSPLLKFTMSGSKVTVYVSVGYTNVGTGTGGTIVDLPTSANSAAFSGAGRENAVIGHGLTCSTVSTTGIVIQKYDTTASLVNGYRNLVTMEYD